MQRNRPCKGSPPTQPWEFFWDFCPDHDRTIFFGYDLEDDPGLSSNFCYVCTLYSNIHHLILYVTVYICM